MTEKIKTMGKIEYGLGVIYGVIVAAYTAGLPVSNQVIVVAIIFTIAYFGHWGFLILDKLVDNRILLARLESERVATTTARSEGAKSISQDLGPHSEYTS